MALLDARARYLFVPLGDRAHVEVTDGAAGEAAKLQMHELLGVWHEHALSAHGLE